MSVTTTHPQYDAMHEQWQMLSDALEEGAVKRSGTLYLPKTSAMIEAQRPSNDDDPILTYSQAQEMYEAYKSRAEYPLWVKDALRSMMGLVTKLTPNIVLPDSLKYLQYNATSDGFDLHQLFLRVVSAGLTKGRCPLVTDVDEKGEFFVAAYTAEAAINWREGNLDGRSDLTLAVLEEQRAKDTGDEFAHETETVYRVLDLFDGKYRVRVMSDSGALLEESFAGYTQDKALDFIPIIFAGSTDSSPKPDELPLLSMAKSALKYYQLSADYYTSLHYTANPQPVVIGLPDDQDLRVTGPQAAWCLPEGGKAEYMEFSGSGIGAIEDAMNAQRNASQEAGAKVVNTGAVESGTARLARQADQHSSLYSVVMTAAESIEQAMKFAAVWAGIDPDSVQFTVEPKFTQNEVDAQLLTVVQNGVMAGELPRTVLYGLLREGGMTSLTDDELDAMREGE